ncbi:MAG: GGDEF domain-containing protein [Bacilli bacterium]|nr:GGDEF domain-containing protein [Bacilli bacterium]
MKNKKIWIGIVLLLACVLAAVLYFYYFKQDKNSTLTLSEKTWIEKQKNSVLDLGVESDLPIFNYEGKGVFLDFVTDIEKDTKLEFNKIAYTNVDTDKTEYRFETTDKASKNDLVLYQDHYVLVGKTGQYYNSLDQLPTLTIGTVGTDIKDLSLYLNENSKFAFKTFDSYEALFENLISPTNTVDVIAVPKTKYLDSILNNSLSVVYQMSDYTRDYVLKLGKNNTLNNILQKYYAKWKEGSQKESYATHFSDSYFTFKKILEKDKSNFRSKRYIYGFVENSPYDFTYGGKLKGINKETMQAFSKVANVEIKYLAYPSIGDMVKDFNTNKLDFMFNNNSTKKYSMDVYQTVSNMESKVAILTTFSNPLEVHSLYSLRDKEVMTVKDTKIEAYLKENGIGVKSYNTIKELLSDKKDDSILAVDAESYQYYVHNNLKEYRAAHEFTLPEGYGYVVRDIKANQVFEQFLSFYMSFETGKISSDHAMEDLLVVSDTLGTIMKFVLYALATVGVFSIAKTIFDFLMKPKEKDKNSIKKEDKIKYMDHLTSLKNRNYLNDNIPSWDESDVYPQTILIIDLNNVAYINDNYGHKEGDAVIAEAANILIKNQVVNSEIIRTSGNEFLIYLVGYNEKQVVSYIRKLGKEFKDLSHGFGAAIGYSMIVDAIKTVDDAINEATLDMRTNKEGNNN